MRFTLLFLSFVLSPLLSVSLAGQQTATTATQASLLLQKAYTALSGGQTLSDVTLSGTARRIAGSDDETGTAILKALATGEARMDLTLPSGARSEVRAASTSGQAGNWSGPDGLSHSISNHNLMTDSSWFFPAFTLGRLLASGNYVVSYVGQ